MGVGTGYCIAEKQGRIKEEQGVKIVYFSERRQLSVVYLEQTDPGSSLGLSDLRQIL